MSRSSLSSDHVSLSTNLDFYVTDPGLTQLLVSFNEIFTSIEEGQAVDTIYFDFKKAFDSIPHVELLYKLWTIGITGPLWFWFKSYLTNRQHYVNIDEHSSQSLPVLSGVPQGSIVGPLLFLAYINDLPNNTDYASIYQFADDTKFIKSILANLASTSDPLLQSDIDLWWPGVKYGNNL